MESRTKVDVSKESEQPLIDIQRNLYIYIMGLLNPFNAILKPT